MLRRICFTLLYSLIVSIEVYSIGASPFAVKIKQSDGTEITVKPHGDERKRWFTTNDGYRVIRNGEGVFEFAQEDSTGEVVLSGLKAADISKRSDTVRQFLKSIPKNIGATSSELKSATTTSDISLKKATASTTGNFKLLVILVNFSNTSVIYDQAAFNKMMNEENYNGSGSFRDYYLENSNGLLDVATTVTSWVKLSKTHDYYGPEAKWGEFAYDAIKAAYNQGVDFSQFDNDGDGEVDGIAIIHQGNGQEASADETDIWSHAWTLSSAGYSSSKLKMGNVTVDSYFTQPELNLTGSDMANIGVVCHEFGHVLGALDYYDTDYEENGSQDGTGSWDLMSGGAYNGNPVGALPAHHNPYVKHQFGWVKETTLDSYANLSLKPVLTSHQIYRYDTPTKGEYFILENRIKQGFDAALPGEGLLIYHVDSTVIAANLSDNAVNATSHQGLYIKVATGTIDSTSCPFPGSSNIQSFTDLTTPASLSWATEKTDKSVTEIEKEGVDISFVFMDLQYGNASDFKASAISNTQVKLSWTYSTEQFPVLIAWASDGVFGTPLDGKEYVVGDLIEGGGIVVWIGNESDQPIFDVDGSSTSFSYQLWSNRGDSYSQPLAATAYAYTKLLFAVNSQAGEIIEGAEVDVADYSSLTDQGGLALLEGDFLSSTYQLFVIRKSGYEDKWGVFATAEVDTLDVELIPIVDVAAEIIDHSIDYHAVSLEWNPVINDNFSSYEPFSLSINGWTQVDNDRAKTYEIESVNFTNEGYQGSFIVFDGYDDNFTSNGYVFKSYVGRQFLASISAKGKANDDWLISPAITVADSMWLSFMARSITDSYGLERMKIWVSESGTSTSSFKLISGSSYISVPVDWTQYVYDLSGYMGKTIHFAINCVSNDAFMLMLDRLMVTNEVPDAIETNKSAATDQSIQYKRIEGDGNSEKSASEEAQSTPVTYDIYRDGVKIGTTSGISETLYVDETPECGKYFYQIKTILGDNHKTISEIDTISSCYQVSMTFNDGIDPVADLSVSFNGETKQTDNSGYVVFGGVDVGSFALLASKTGFKNLSNTETIADDVSLDLTIELDDSNSRTLVTYGDEVILQLPDEYTGAAYDIISLTGKIVAKGEVTSYRFAPDLTNLAKGIYLFRIYLHDRTEVVKVRNL